MALHEEPGEASWRPQTERGASVLSGLFRRVASPRGGASAASDLFLSNRPSILDGESSAQQGDADRTDLVVGRRALEATGRHLPAALEGNTTNGLGSNPGATAYQRSEEQSLAIRAIIEATQCGPIGSMISRSTMRVVTATSIMNASNATSSSSVLPRAGCRPCSRSLPIFPPTCRPPSGSCSIGARSRASWRRYWVDDRRCRLSSRTMPWR
mgnify:CR=1 FL=1